MRPEVVREASSDLAVRHAFALIQSRAESLAKPEEPAPAEQEPADESRERGIRVVQTAMELADAGKRAA